MIELPIYIITCSKCGVKANANSREADGWTIAPKVLCADCNGHNATPVWRIPAEEKGMFIEIPKGGELNE